MIDNKNDTRIIEFCGDKYELMKNESGEISIRRYNEKYKMWVRVIFSNNPSNDPAEYIKEILSKQYIERFTGTGL